MNVRAGIKFFGEGLAIGAEKHVKRMIEVGVFGLISPIGVAVGYSMVKVAPTVGVLIMVGSAMMLPSLALTLLVALPIEAVLVLLTPAFLMFDGIKGVCDGYSGRKLRP